MMEPTRVSAAGVSRWLAVVSTLAITLVASPARADPGDPIAVSRWPGGAITVETNWGLQLVIAPATPPRGQAPRPVGSVVIEPTEHYHHLLERRPNEATVKWRRRAPGEVKTRPNAVQVDTLAEDADGHSLVRISVDSATIVIAPPDYKPTARSKNADALPTTDLLVLGVAAGAGDPGAGAKRLADLLNPSVVVMNPAKDVQPDTLKQVQESLGMRSADPRQHNSLCVAAGSTDEQAPYSVLLEESPWEASGELESLFTAMEQACLNAQQVFKDLTTEQLNFQPANGTHTPRWNAEHMMGRQLQFFSQIYHAVDPTIAVRDLNPRQNPEDYRAAHPDWDGEEEARQMQRVSDFTRRFAYLLDGVSLDKPAPGSRWTLRRLLRQMPRHYDEHTANTMKKFDLPGWPGDPPASR